MRFRIQTAFCYPADAIATFDRIPTDSFSLVRVLLYDQGSQRLSVRLLSRHVDSSDLILEWLLFIFSSKFCTPHSSDII